MDSLAEIRHMLFDEQISTTREPESSEGSLMIIDDNADIIDALTSLLKPYFRLVSCVSYQDAKRKLSTEIRVVLLDIKMAGKDGIETFRLLKKEREDLQIIFHSAYPGTLEPLTAVDGLNHSGYLTKGEYDLPELLTLVRRAMNPAA